MTERQIDPEELGMDNPEGAAGYGIQNLASPGEPNRDAQDAVDPVPGTAKQTRDEREGLRGGQHDVTEGSGHRGGHSNR
jgi:hypothetical protein